MSKIFYVMGKSASGKDTMYQQVKEALPELQTVVIYTTRPMREGEEDGVTYHFVEEAELARLQEAGKVIELRAYQTVHGVWKYFTVDDGQFDGERHLLAIGTLESYVELRNYFGAEKMVPVYIEVEDGMRLERALARERQQVVPKYEEMCRRFLADAVDFSEENLHKAGIQKRYQNLEMKSCLEEILLGIREKI